MLRAALRDGTETRADLDALDGVDAHHRGCNIGVELVVDGLAPADRYTGGDDFDARAARITRLAQSIHERLQLRNQRVIRDEERVGVDVLEALDRHHVRVELRQVATDLDAIPFAHPLACDRTRRDANRGLARRLPSAAAIIAYSVFVPIRIVGVARPERIGDIRVVLAARVLVADQQRDRRAGGGPLEHAGEDLDGIGFATLRDMPRRTRLAPIELALDVGLRQRKAGGAAVDDAADRGPVRFAERSDAEEFAERVSGHRGALKNRRSYGTRGSVNAARPPDRS